VGIDRVAGLAEPSEAGLDGGIGHRCRRLVGREWDISVEHGDVALETGHHGDIADHLLDLDQTGGRDFGHRPVIRFVNRTWGDVFDRAVAVAGDDGQLLGLARGQASGGGEDLDRFDRRGLGISRGRALGDPA